MRIIYIIGLFIFLPFIGFSQTKGNLAGEVLDKNTQKPISGASIQIVNAKFATISDSIGKFTIKGIPTGQYHIIINYVGSIPYHLYNVAINTGNINYITAELLPMEITFKEVIVGNVKKSVRAATLETPLSIQKLTAEEIKSSPGSNFDISKVVQTLPGVTGSATTGAGFRNDIIVRGGAPNENVFYLDGIEIPVINHFSTQGSAGGPQGILNVSFIDEVKLSSSAFDAKYDNALSSVFEFKQKKGSSEKIQGNFRLGATEVASTLEGPLSKTGKTTFLLSARRSYLQFLFQALDLPIRPNYWDFQYKISHQIDTKTTLTLLGVGAIDKFYYVAPKNSTPEKNYALNISPTINQWSYTVGASIKKLVNKGYWNLSISRSHLNNVNEKYEDNLNPIKGEKTLDYNSNDISNSVRFDITKSFLGLKWTTGANLQNIEYDNSTYQVLPKPYIDSALLPYYLPAPSIYKYASQINYNKYGAFFQIGKRAFNNRLGISAGIRTDGNGFNTEGNQLLKRLSPRFGFSYVLTDKVNLNASVGRYYKIAPNTVLGFKDLTNNFVNKNAYYIGADHYVVGLEFLPNEATRFTAEVFYKKYFNVPISIRKGLSLSNLGADFNILGNEPVMSNGKGRSYGFELFAQHKLTDRFYGVASYSFFRSAYTDINDKYINSAWENIHVLSLTGGYKFNKNWELGIKYRFQGGTPYTPYDLAASKINFLTQGLGVLDYTKTNSLRLPNYHSSDIRVDKKYNYKKTTFDIFIDITNWYGSKSVSPNVYTFESNTDGTFKTTDGGPIKKDGSNAKPTLTDNNRIFVTPTFGFIWEF
jgi:hypothetical protein